MASTGHLLTDGPSISPPPDAVNTNSPPAPSPPPILVAANGQTSTITPAPTPIASDVAVASAPVIVILDGVSSTLSAGQIATDSKGASIPVLTEVNGQIYTVVGVITPIVSGTLRARCVRPDFNQITR